jgi:transcriptional regulator with XRE-family HTH domain
MTRSAYSAGYVRLREGLIEARQARGLTQTQLAAALDRPQSFVSKFESGERRLDVVEVLEIAGILELGIGDLVRRVRGE